MTVVITKHDKERLRLYLSCFACIFFIEGSYYARKRRERSSGWAPATNQNRKRTQSYFSMVPIAILIHTTALPYSTSIEAKWKPRLSLIKLMAVEWPHPTVRTQFVSRMLFFIMIILHITHFIYKPVNVFSRCVPPTPCC